MVDKDGEVLDSTALSRVSFPSSDTPTIQYYKTTLDNSSNSATGDVYADLELRNFKNDADVKVGVTSPVINEKGFNITSTPASHTQTRIYFIPTKAYSAFWYQGDKNQSNFDMNLRYYVGGDDEDVQMDRKANTNSAYKDASDNSTVILAAASALLFST